MNRGSALKWIEELENTNWKYEPSQLRFNIDGQPYGNAHGILANFLNPGGWKVTWDGISYTMSGNQFELTSDMRKRVKMKHNTTTPIDFGGNRGVATFYEIELSIQTHKEMATFIEQHYQVL